MELVIQIIVGIVGIAVGFYMTWKPQVFIELIGEQEWMEKLFGIGRSMFGYQVLGIILCFVSLLIMTGFAKGMLLWFFAPAIPGA